VKSTHVTEDWSSFEGIVANLYAIPIGIITHRKTRSFSKVESPWKLIDEEIVQQDSSRSPQKLALYCAY
jgi:hypothetical protein